MIRTSGYRAPWWLRNRHLQTLIPNSPLRHKAALTFETENLELPDGDFIRLHRLPSDGPIVLLLHGLEGSSESRYARSVMQALHSAGWCPVLMHFRGCGGVPNRLARSYHAGETEDLTCALAHLERSYPDRPVAALGYSLGGNVLLKYLGEQGEDTRLRTAVAVSVPFDLQDACAAVSQGFSRFYRHVLLRRMKASLRRKFERNAAPFDYEQALQAKDFEEFDELVTAPLHGFACALDYYRHSSCRAYLPRIQVPTLILHAIDDPFMTPAAVPTEPELSEAVTLELSEHGGHVGFLTGNAPWNLTCWLEDRIVEHLGHYLGAPSAPQPTTPTEVDEPLTATG